MNRLTDPGYIPEKIVANMSNEQLAEMYRKLCGYERTGLEPNEICEMIDDHTFLIESTCNEKEKLGKFARQLRQHKIEINGVIFVSDTLFEMICRVIEGTEEL